MNKKIYAVRCFGLPVEQIRLWSELSKSEQALVLYHFGNKQKNDRYVYAVKCGGGLAKRRELLRAEWV